MPGHRHVTLLGLALGGTVLVSAVLLTGCGVGAGGGTSLPSTPASPADSPRPPATSPPVPIVRSVIPSATSGDAAGGGTIAACGTLRLKLTSDQASYRSGATVHLTATLTNAGPATCTIQAGAQRGFAVASGSTAIWRSGCSTTPAGHTATEPCPQFLSLMPIRAGQTLTRTQDWSQRADGTDKQVAAGSYLVAESWAGSTASVTITVS